jgi:hypothetical protein
MTHLEKPRTCIFKCRYCKKVLGGRTASACDDATSPRLGSPAAPPPPLLLLLLLLLTRAPKLASHLSGCQRSDALRNARLYAWHQQGETQHVIGTQNIIYLTQNILQPPLNPLLDFKDPYCLGAQEEVIQHTVY